MMGKVGCSGCCGQSHIPSAYSKYNLQNVHVFLCLFAWDIFCPKEYGRPNRAKTRSEADNTWIESNTGGWSERLQCVSKRNALRNKNIRWGRSNIQRDNKKETEFPRIKEILKSKRQDKWKETNPDLDRLQRNFRT